MIFTSILVVLFAVIKGLMFFPNVPPAPAALTSMATWLIDLIATAVEIMDLVYSPVLMIMMAGVFLGLFAFENVYYSIMWIIKKIPFLNIK